MTTIDLVLENAKKYHVSITEAAALAGVSRRNIYQAKMRGRTEIADMRPSERKHLLAIQELCEKHERENKRIMRIYGNKR